MRQAAAAKTDTMKKLENTTLMPLEFHPFPTGVETTTTPKTVLIKVDLEHKDKTLPAGLHQDLTGVVFADSEEQTEDALSEDARSEDARSKAVEEPDFGSDPDNTWPDWRKEAQQGRRASTKGSSR